MSQAIKKLIIALTTLAAVAAVITSLAVGLKRLCRGLPTGNNEDWN